MKILSTYYKSTQKSRPSKEGDKNQAQQSFDLIFDWNCFGPSSENSELSQKCKDFHKLYPDQGKADFDQHYDMDGVTIWKGEIITTSDPG